MSDFEIDFEWPVAKYNFEPAPSASEEIQIAQKDAKVLRELLKERLHIRSDWELRERLRSDWLEDFPQEPEKNAPWEEISEENDLSHPHFDGGYLEFGSLVRTGKPKNARPTAEAMKLAIRLLVERERIPLHKVALTIARKIGGLTRFEREPLSMWDGMAYELRLMFEGKSKRSAQPWPHPGARYKGPVGVYLVPDKEGRPRLALRPGTLRQAMILCATRMIATGTTFHTCEHCNAPFLGGGAGLNKKRADARFCSDRCRWGHHNKAKRKAR